MSVLFKSLTAFIGRPLTLGEAFGVWYGMLGYLESEIVYGVSESRWVALPRQR
jgi:hypothetical protein